MTSKKQILASPFVFLKKKKTRQNLQLRHLVVAIPPVIPNREATRVFWEPLYNASGTWLFQLFGGFLAIEARHPLQVQQDPIFVEFATLSLDTDEGVMGLEKKKKKWMHFLGRVVWFKKGKGNMMGPWGG